MKAEKKKVLFVGQNLNIGGVQKAFVNQLNKTVKSGDYDITVFVFSKGPFENELPDNIRVIEGNKILKLTCVPISEVKANGKFSELLLRVGLAVFAKIIGWERFYRLCFHKMPEKYDAAVSYFTDVPYGSFNKGTNLFVADYVDADVKAAWVHNDPILGNFGRENCLRAYKKIDKIICVSDAVREKFNILVPEYKDRTETMHNVFEDDKIKALSAEFDPFEKSRFDIVTVAREDNEAKRIDGIIRLCRRLKDSGISDFRWRVIGGGPDIEKNKKFAEDIGVDDVISLEDEKKNPYPYIKKSDLFALFSAYEGFPLVIGEAMILGVPILTSNYAAAKEQIPLQNGTIAENDEDFFEKLKSCIEGHK